MAHQKKKKNMKKSIKFPYLISERMEKRNGKLLTYTDVKKVKNKNSINIFLTQFFVVNVGNDMEKDFSSLSLKVTHKIFYFEA